VQHYILKELQTHWDEYDAFIIEAPVAAGKSLVATTLAEWRNKIGDSVAILTPKTILQDQYQRDYPKIPSLKGKSKYSCKSKYADTCQDYYEAAGQYCCGGGCTYKEAVEVSKEAPTSILNFHSHLFGGLSQDVYKDILILDESHNIVSMLSEIYTLKIWKHKDNYPHQSHTKYDIISWLIDEIARLEPEVKRLRAQYSYSKKMPKVAQKLFTECTGKLNKYKMIKEGLEAPNELFHIAKREMQYGRSKGLKEYIEVKPKSLKTVPHKMWPDESVKKLVLMSATIYDKDIERLGIKRKRVYTIKCDSPIPVEQRPIRIESIAPMSFKHVKDSSRLLSNRIKQLADEHKGKGIVHITYGLVKEFKKHLKGDRYLWHDKDNSKEIYQEFIKSEGNQILMACGMGEGIDLVGEDFQWQVIAKIIFPSLADPLQKHFLEKDPLVYVLETVRTTIQQSGRICRTPTDYGVTYILDSSFDNFYRRNFKLFPEYFKRSLQWKKK
jgi:Rad3-related DNA helicase